MARQQVGRITKPRTRLGPSGRLSAGRVNLVLNDSAPTTSQAQAPMHLYQPQYIPQVTPEPYHYQVVQSVQEVRQPFREIGNIHSMQQPTIRQSFHESNQIEHDSESGNEAELFTKPMNLMGFFKNSFTGNLLVNQIESVPIGEEVSHELTCKIVNFVMQKLLEICGGVLNLKRDKVDVLHNVAQSIVITFPVFKTAIRRGENWKWTHVRICFSVLLSV